MGRNTWSGDDERDMCTSIVEKLFVPDVADAVIGHEEHDGVFQYPFFF